MAKYRITCTRLEDGAEPARKPHIVAVGTGRSAGHFDTLWAIDEVVHAMEQGHIFYTQGARSGRIIRIETVVCPVCQRTFLCSEAKPAGDGDLENLPHCEERREWAGSRNSPAGQVSLTPTLGREALLTK